MDSLKTILSEREKCKKAKKAVFHNLEYILLVWCIHIQRWISEPLKTSTSAPSHQHRHHIYLYLSRTPAVFSPFIYNISSPSTPHDHLKNAYTTLLLQECVFSSYFHKCPGSFLVFFDPHWVFPYFPPNIKNFAAGLYTTACKHDYMIILKDSTFHTFHLKTYPCHFLHLWESLIILPRIFFPTVFPTFQKRERAWKKLGCWLCT